MKYAFIDYENLNSLDGLALQEYDRLFLFVGASNNQTEIRLTEKFSDEINITLIKIKSIAKNNVDFHIAYYLGKLDEQADKNVEFYILSNDQGYDGICDFIQHKKQGRVCQRKGVQLEKQPIAQTNNTEEVVFQKYVQYMKQTATKHLPVKLKALKNNIRSHTGLVKINKKEAEKFVDKVVDKLLSDKWIKLVDNKVSYPKG
ncbi:PIN domain-containing protein [Mannheimia sp. E30BD]|uniref:PIN domain-containing protein n=1 Tax=Mannheimia sp. E30BD TaxID=3278708 RepID=UPI00359E026B